MNFSFHIYSPISSSMQENSIVLNIFFSSSHSSAIFSVHHILLPFYPIHLIFLPSYSLHRILPPSYPIHPIHLPCYLLHRIILPSYFLHLIHLGFKSPRKLRLAPSGPRYLSCISHGARLPAAYSWGCPRCVLTRFVPAPEMGHNVEDVLNFWREGRRMSRREKTLRY